MRALNELAGLVSCNNPIIEFATGPRAVDHTQDSLDSDQVLERGRIYLPDFSALYLVNFCWKPSYVFSDWPCERKEVPDTNRKRLDCCSSRLKRKNRLSATCLRHVVQYIVVPQSRVTINKISVPSSGLHWSMQTRLLIFVRIRRFAASEVAPPP